MSLPWSIVNSIYQLCEAQPRSFGRRAPLTSSFVNFGFVNFDFVNFAQFLLLNFAHFLLLKFKIRIASSYILAHTHTASRINSTQNRQIVRSSVPRTPQVFQLFLEISPVAEFHFYCRCAACLFASLSYFDSWINTSYITII